jgi:hypothetical protein
MKTWTPIAKARHLAEAPFRNERKADRRQRFETAPARVKSAYSCQRYIDSQSSLRYRFSASNR